MSWQSVTLVAEHSRSRLGARLVMLTLANHDAEQGCFVSVERIAKEANLSVRQVLRCLKELETLGELGIDRGAGINGTNRYTFLLPQRLPQMADDKMSRDVLTHDKAGPGMSPEQNQPLGVEVERTPSTSVLPTSALPARSSDGVFEVLFFVDTGLTYTPEARATVTPTALAAINAAASEIRGTGITAPELASACAAWPDVMGGVTMTANAVKKHLPRLRAAANGIVARRSSSEVDDALREVERRRQAG